MIEILLDKITNCLEDQEGNEYNTFIRLRKTSINKTEISDWKFDWNSSDLKESEIYELFIKGIADTQGRIAIHLEGGVVKIDLIESAPWNVGHLNGYQGVGFHLFALACKISFDKNCEGYVCFEPKTRLRKYFIKQLKAQPTAGNLLGIFPKQSQYLVDTYFDNCEVITDE